MSDYPEHAVRAIDGDPEAGDNLIAGFKDSPSYPVRPAARNRMLRQLTLDMAKIARSIGRFGQSTPEPIPDQTPKPAAELQLRTPF